MDESRIRGSPGRGLASATLGFFVGFAGVVSYGPVASEFEGAMGLSGLALGLLVAAPQLSGSLLRIPFGAWVDDAGAKKPFLVLLALSLVGMAGLSAILVTAYPDGLTMELYPLVFFFGALSGCGIATFSVGSTQTSDWFPREKQGGVLAIYAGLGNTSPALFTLLLPVALAALGLTRAYLAWFAFLAVGTVVYAILAVDPPSFQLRERGLDAEAARERAGEFGQELFPGGDTFASIREAAAIRRTWVLVALFFTSFGGFLALTVWLPSYWTAVHDVGVQSAGALTAVAFTLLAALIRVPGGYLSDHIGGELTAVGSFVVVGLAALALVVTREYATAVGATVLLAVGIGVANAAVFQLVPAYVPEAVGGASGLVGGLGAFGGFVLPPVIGAFVDLHGDAGYATGFVVFALLALGMVNYDRGNPKKALPLWLELVQRDPGHKAVQEALMLAPRAYEDLGAKPQSLAGYQHAADTYRQELRNVETAIRQINEIEWLEKLKPETPPERAVPDPMSDLDDYTAKSGPQMTYLYKLFASHEFARMFRQYVQLDRLRMLLGQWERALPAMGETLARQKSELSAAMDPVRKQLVTARQQQRKLETRAHKLVSDIPARPSMERPEDVAGYEELIMWQRVQKLEKKLDNASGRQAERLRRVRGLLLWDIARDAEQQRQQQQRHAGNLVEKTALAGVRTQSVEQLVRDATRRVRGDLDERFSDKYRRLGSLQDEVNALIDDVKQVLKNDALEVLAERRQRLADSLGQARLAIARVQDESVSDDRQQRSGETTNTDEEAETQ